MAKISIPPPDIPVLDPETGLMDKNWYDALKALERLNFVDLADFDNSTPATNNQVAIYKTATGKWTPGAN